MARTYRKHKLHGPPYVTNIHNIRVWERINYKHSIRRQVYVLAIVVSFNACFVFNVLPTNYVFQLDACQGMALFGFCFYFGIFTFYSKSSRCIATARHFLWFITKYTTWAASNETHAFEFAQNVRIHVILCMRKVSSGPLFSVSTSCSIAVILLADSEGPDQTARMRRLIRAFALRICLSTRFRLTPPTYSMVWLSY